MILNDLIDSCIEYKMNFSKLFTLNSVPSKSNITPFFILVVIYNFTLLLFGFV